MKSSSKVKISHSKLLKIATSSERLTQSRIYGMVLEFVSIRMVDIMKALGRMIKDMVEVLKSSATVTPI